MLPESNPRYSPVTKYGDNDVVICLGTVTTGANTGNKNIIGEQNKVILQNGGGFIGSKWYGSLPLEEYITKLTKMFKDNQKLG